MATAAAWAPIQGAAPAVALLASRGADDLVAAKGFLSISQLLAPFAATTANVRDPSTGLAVSSKITLDFRDLKKDGYLLSHTVLPHVLHEALQSSPGSGAWSVEGSARAFNDALAQWTEPIEQETFRTYLSCLFFVSTRDENALAALSQLIQMQHSQQHSSDGLSLAPSHCARPLWTTPATLKHYVILYEGSEEQRSREIFSQMCSTYGIESCSQLRLDGALAGGRGGGEEDGIGSPDPWASRLGAYRTLEAGLERARLSLIEKAAAAAAAPASPSTPGMGITTIASSYSINSAASASPSTVLPPPPRPPTSLQHLQQQQAGSGVTSAASSSSASAASTPFDPLSPAGGAAGPPLSPEGRATAPDSRRVTTQADKDACARLVEDYVRNNLVPHAERVMRTLNEAVAGRRGISRSLASGMKKWFGGGGTSGGGGGTSSGDRNGGGGSGGGGSGAAAMTYSSESPQMQMRRLADIAFLFGLNAFAHSQYQAVKKEFAADSAWLHHALALEMSAYSLHLAHPQLTAAQFRCDYVENALSGLLQNGARWPSLLRAGLHAARVHAHLELHTQAAAQLVRLTTIENDGAVGVALWAAAAAFERARMHRKAAFYRFLAAHRWSKARQPQLQLAAAAAAFPEYLGKRWSLAEERLALELSSWSADGRAAIGAAERLLVARPTRTPEETEAHLAHYGRVRARHAGTEADAAAARAIPAPTIDAAATRVICGERPLAAELSGSGAAAAAAATSPAGAAAAAAQEEKWRAMERVAFHAIAGTSTAFRPMHIVSDAATDNTRVRETPAGERFRVQIRVRNPLPVPLQLRDVHLAVAEVELRAEGGENGEQAEEEEEGAIRVHHIDTLHLGAEEERMLELWLTPSARVASFRVSAVLFQLCCAPGVVAAGEIALHIQGRRLNQTAKQMKSVVRAADERLRATVAARAWPLADVRVTRGAPAPGATIYTDQLLTLHVEIANGGPEAIEGLALAVDTVDRVMVEEAEGGGDDAASSPLRLPLAAPSPLDLPAAPGVRAFALRGAMERGARRRVIVQVRAPAAPAAAHSLRLLLAYRGVGGATREWRLRVSCRVVRLLHATTRVLDPYHGLVALSLRNALTSADAALARLECTRVRAAVGARARGAVLARAERGLVAVRSAGGGGEEEETRVRLESGQAQEVCVRVSAPDADRGEREGDASEARTDDSWRLVEGGEMPPEWPLPLGKGEEEEWGRRRLQLAVAWKANIVGNDGLVHSILGETFVADPFAAAGLQLVGLQLGCSLSSPGGVASPIPPADNDDGNDDDEDGSGAGAAAPPPVYVTALPLAPIEHDFGSKRICEFPVRLVVRNECARGRDAEVEVRARPKVRESGVPPPRQQWWLARECVRTRVAARATQELTLMVRVTQPSAYDLLGAQLACTVRMDAAGASAAAASAPSRRWRSLRVPPLMAVVYEAYGGEQA